MLRLKQEPGKNILVGGVSIPSQLIELGLVDEYRFVVGPILAGEGRRLMEGVSLPEKLQLRLVESKPFQRCLRCNVLLQPVSKESVRDRLAPRTAQCYDQFQICPGCDRVYWPGSRYEHMQRFIEHVLAA